MELYISFHVLKQFGAYELNIETWHSRALRWRNQFPTQIVLQVQIEALRRVLEGLRGPCHSGFPHHLNRDPQPRHRQPLAALPLPVARQLLFPQ